jgi:predicted metallopeptidase
MIKTSFKGDPGMIEYFHASDIKRQIDKIVELLNFHHIHPDSIYCIRSRGSRAKRVIARIHGLSRIWQEAMRLEPSYIIEVLAERFDYMNEDEKEKTLIHELLHIPHSFGGGFRPHKGYVDMETVEVWYKRLQQKKMDRNVSYRNW